MTPSSPRSPVVAGVDAVHVDVDHRTVAVTGEASDDALRAAIDEAGYEVAGEPAVS